MKSVDTGKDKVQKICEVLKKDTLDPARKAASALIQDAELQAKKIIDDAKMEAGNYQRGIRRQLDEERSVFESSINLACKKAIEALKYDVEKALFNPALEAFIDPSSQDAEIIAQFISAIVKGIEKEGVSGDLKAFVSGEVSKESVVKALAKSIIDKLSSNKLESTAIRGGAQVKIIDKHLTIDLSDQALKELLASFVREDLRRVIFATS